MLNDSVDASVNCAVALLVVLFFMSILPCQAETSGNSVLRNTLSGVYWPAAYVSVAPGFTIDHNIYPDAGWHWLYGNSAMKFESWKSMAHFDKVGSMIADPLFVSASDFHLQAFSPAIDKGMAVGLTTDHDGNRVPLGKAPDIGAYEYLQ